MAEKEERVAGGEEITVFQIDMVAFIHAKADIRPSRRGTTLSPSNNMKRVPFWAYERTPAVEAAISEWSERAEDSTRHMLSFRDKQLLYRQEKSALERGV